MIGLIAEMKALNVAVKAQPRIARPRTRKAAFRRSEPLTLAKSPSDITGNTVGNDATDDGIDVVGCIGDATYNGFVERSDVVGCRDGRVKSKRKSIEIAKSSRRAIVQAVESGSAPIKFETELVNGEETTSYTKPVDPVVSVCIPLKPKSARFADDSDFASWNGCSMAELQGGDIDASYQVEMWSGNVYPGSATKPDGQVASDRDEAHELVIGMRMQEDQSESFLGVMTLRQPKGTILALVPQDWGEIELTVDSGASDTVMPEGTCPLISLLESVGSKAGYEYEVANGEGLPNL